MDWAWLQQKITLGLMVSLFLLVAVWETKRPFRENRIPTGKRWAMHFVLMIVTILLNLVVTGLTPVAAALAAQEAGFGLFVRMPVSLWISVPVGVLALDVSKYAMHRLFHAVPWLWPIHRVHHSDPDFDVATSVRFHPGETYIMQGVGMVTIFLLGVPPAAAFVSSMLTTIINIVQHANANLPDPWERRLQPWVLTARAHRIHHSDEWQDEHRNFGEIFAFWDRWFGSFTAKPVRGAAMDVGLRGYQDEQSIGLLEMLLQPFKPERKPQQ